MPGPSVRTDIVEVYVFTRSRENTGDLSFLQLRRRVEPMAGSWQPVMGHIEKDETAAKAGLRELREETGLSPSVDHDGPLVWQLEAVNTFFLASLDAILMCPGFAAEVSPDVSITIDDAHDDFRWISQTQFIAQPDTQFLWPGQRVAAHQIIEEIAPPDGRLARYLRLPF